VNRSCVSGIKRSANKDLDALDDSTYIRIDRNIQKLINDPFPRGVKKLTDEENILS
jgi:mRNA-degrading endonuclease RelE of RelBE toxin-antitoxin system